MEITHICFVCNKEFVHAPYYLREGRIMQPVCSKYCLHEYYGDWNDNYE